MSDENCICNNYRQANQGVDVACFVCGKGARDEASHLIITIVAKVSKLVDTTYDDNEVPCLVMETKIVYVKCPISSAYTELQHFENLAADMGDGFSSAVVLAVHDAYGDVKPTDSKFYTLDKDEDLEEESIMNQDDFDISPDDGHVQAQRNANIPRPAFDKCNKNHPLVLVDGKWDCPTCIANHKVFS